MTPKQLDELKTHMRATMLENILLTVVASMCVLESRATGISPQETLNTMMAKAVSGAETLTIPELGAAYSDMIAHEYTLVLEQFRSDVSSIFPK